MKSAYELAMERLAKEAPMSALSEEQKKAIAEVDSLYQSKIAEKEVFLSELIVKARFQGDFAEVRQLEEQKARELSRLREEAESEKEKIRKQTS